MSRIVFSFFYCLVTPGSLVQILSLGHCLSFSYGLLVSDWVSTVARFPPSKKLVNCLCLIITLCECVGEFVWCPATDCKGGSCSGYPGSRSITTRRKQLLKMNELIMAAFSSPEVFYIGLTAVLYHKHIFIFTMLSICCTFMFAFK